MLTLLEAPKVSLDVETHSIIDIIHASGEGVSFTLSNLNLNFSDFFLQIERSNAGDLLGIGVTASAVQPEALALLAEFLPSPLQAGDSLDFAFAQVVLLMRPEVVDAIQFVVAEMEELQELLDLQDTEGQSVIFNLHNYVIDSISEVTEAGMVDPAEAPPAIE